MPGVALTEMKDSEVSPGFGGTFSIKFGEFPPPWPNQVPEHHPLGRGNGRVVGDPELFMLDIEGRLRGRELRRAHALCASAGVLARETD